MAYEIVWAESAAGDLIEAVEFIARDSPSYAATLVARATAAADSLKDLPHRGHPVREYRDPNVRELIVGRSYRLIYRVLDLRVTLIAFVHVARDLGELVPPE